MKKTYLGLAISGALLLLAAAVFVFSTATLTHAPAPSAVTLAKKPFNCGGTCIDKDPHKFYGGVRCSDGAYIKASDTVKDSNKKALAQVQRWYSPKCQTEWGQVVWQAGKAYGIALSTYTFKPAYYCYVWDGTPNCEFANRNFYTGGKSPLWTPMVPAGHVTVTGIVRIEATGKTYGGGSND